MAHECSKEEFLGQVKEFMNNSKGLKATMFGIVVAIILQVISFAYLWGGLVTTVKAHDTAIDRLVNKFDKLKVVGYAIANDNGRTP